MSRRKNADRASVFAQGALKKGWVTRSQAQECVAIARKLERRGKPLSIEEVFVRKGYLTKADAHSLAKRIRPAKSAAKEKVKLGAPRPAAQPLALAEEEETCPNCGIESWS